ncbi:MAG: hypothetical protein RL094_110 [Candidatus Parcubacteria bacterium]|jgi:hypothetical protein
MMLKSHIVAGVVGTALFYPLLGPWKSSVFFTASVLIDADHYLDYLWKTKFADWSPKQMFRYYDKVIDNRFDKRKLGFSILHTVELYVVIYLLAVYVHYDFFLTILGGMAYHMIFDVVSMAWQRLHFVRPFSIVEYLIRKKRMQKMGLDPDEFYRDMYLLSVGKPIEGQTTGK